ncbi:hypothetical protein Vadar_012617 [Vaccinium darrowii]|uniref:Uncharacterized protein n=1 Tax=Vaccinium darrowii TaxID=229202 RepID=A0ACB7X9Y2_9ERIC|nr:hypothetical protein Vadar_012617 [Vaccinium darrowii]
MNRRRDELRGHLPSHYVSEETIIYVDGDIDNYWSCSDGEFEEQDFDIENQNDNSKEKDVYWKYIPLYQAALRGDWSNAETFFNENEGSLTAKINEYSDTALHIAAGAGRSSKSIDFITKLVDKILKEGPGELVLDTISEEALKKLEIGDKSNCTALHIAAWAGNNEVVDILLRKRPSLIYIRDINRRSALDLAARNAKKDTLNYLLNVTKGDPLSKLFPKDVCTKKNDPSPNPLPDVINIHSAIVPYTPPTELVPYVIQTPSESDPNYDEDSAAAFLVRVITSGFYGE